MPDNSDLTVGSIPGHVRRIAIPAAVGISFITLYHVVDNFYAGLLSTDGLAVLSLATSAMFLIFALGMSLNTAMVALVGNALGGEGAAAAGRMARQGIAYAVALSVGVLVAGLGLAPLLVKAISVPGALREATTMYLYVAIVSAPAFIVSIGANGILIAEGNAVPMLRAQIASFLANIGLNPLLMFGIPGLVPGIGILGIAVSTLLCQTGVMVYILLRLRGSVAMSATDSSPFRLRADHWRAITGMVFPVLTGWILIVAGIFIVQVYLRTFGPQAIAAFGVGLRIEQALLLPAMSVAVAMRAVASQNFGAGQDARVRQAVRYCCKAGVGLMAGAAVLLWVAGKPLVALFSHEPEVIRIGAEFLRYYGLMLPGRAAIFIAYSLLQAFKLPSLTLGLAIYQEIFAITAFVGAFVWLLETGGTQAVWLGVATSVYTGMLLAFAVASRTARREVGGLFRDATA